MPHGSPCHRDVIMIQLSDDLRNVFPFLKTDGFRIISAFFENLNAQAISKSADNVTITLLKGDLTCLFTVGFIPHLYRLPETTPRIITGK